jgi:hypothetical protein
LEVRTAERPFCAEYCEKKAKTYINPNKGSKVKSADWLRAIKGRRIDLLKERMIFKLKGADKMRFRGKNDCGVENRLVRTWRGVE